MEQGEEISFDINYKDYINVNTQSFGYPLAEYFACLIAKEINAKVYYEEGDEIILTDILNQDHYDTLLKKYS